MKQYITIIAILMTLILAGCVTDTSTETTTTDQSSSSMSMDVSSSSSTDVATSSSSSSIVLGTDSVVIYDSIEELQAAVGHVVDSLGAERYCVSIDTALPHGINPAIDNFIITMKASGTTDEFPQDYDSLVTTMSILRCQIRVNTDDTVIYEITHEGNSASGLIPLHKIINVEINGSFYTDSLDTQMYDVVKSHRNNSVGTDGCVFPSQYPIVLSDVQ